MKMKAQKSGLNQIDHVDKKNAAGKDLIQNPNKLERKNHADLMERRWNAPEAQWKIIVGERESLLVRGVPQNEDTLV